MNFSLCSYLSSGLASVTVRDSRGETGQGRVEALVDLADVLLGLLRRVDLASSIAARPSRQGHELPALDRANGCHGLQPEPSGSAHRRGRDAVSDRPLAVREERLRRGHPRPRRGPLRREQCFLSQNCCAMGSICDDELLNLRLVGETKCVYFLDRGQRFKVSLTAIGVGTAKNEQFESWNVIIHP